MRLTPEQKTEILRLYESDGLSKRALAKMYGVSRGTIYFIINPEAAELNRRRNYLRNKKARSER